MRAHAQRQVSGTCSQRQQGGGCACVRARAGDGTEAHAPRRKITGVDLDTAPFADLMSDRAEGTGERGTTGDQTPSRRDRRMETPSAEEEEGS